MANATSSYGSGGIEQVGEDGPSGMCMGKATTSKLSFYGAAPVVQQTGAITAGDATTIAVTTGGYMFATSTQAAAVIACAIAMQKLGLTS